MPDPERKWLSLYVTDFAGLAAASSSRLCSAVDSPDDSGGSTSDSDTPCGEDAAPPRAARVGVAALPDSVLRAVFVQLDAASLACAAQTCIGWRALAYDPALWRALAARTWPAETRRDLERRLWRGPRPGPYGTWRRLVALRPRLRDLGFYVQRNQYAKSRSAAVNTDGTPAPPVFLVTYWRFLRFFPDGHILALTTPEPPDLAYRRLLRSWRPQPSDARKARPSAGSYVFHEDSRVVDITLPLENELYPRAMTGYQHLSMSLSGSHEGAFNRLYQMDNFAIMDDGSVISYQEGEPGIRHGSAFRFIPLHGFAQRIFKHYPAEANAEGRLPWVRSGRL